MIWLCSKKFTSYLMHYSSRPKGRTVRGQALSKYKREREQKCEKWVKYPCIKILPKTIILQMFKCCHPFSKVIKVYEKIHDNLIK
jgi:hypothetical protein